MTLRKELLAKADEFLNVWKKDHRDHPVVLEEILNFKRDALTASERRLPDVSGGVDYIQMLLSEDQAQARLTMINRFIGIVTNYKIRTQSLRKSYVEADALPIETRNKAFAAITAMFTKIGYLVDVVGGIATGQEVTLDVIISSINDLKTSYMDLLESLQEQTTRVM